VRLLAIGVTPWDIIAYCGGTLALCAAAGDEVTIAPLAGHRRGRGYAGAAQAAADAVGARLDYAGTTSLQDCRAARDELMDIIREANPDVMVSSSPNARSAGERAAAELIFNAAYGACVPNYPSPSGRDAVAVRAPILHMDSVALTDEDGLSFVDIGEAWPRKDDALGAFGSPDGDLPEEARHARWRGEVLSRARGVQVQTAWAEAFGQAQVWGRLTTRRLLPGK